MHASEVDVVEYRRPPIAANATGWTAQGTESLSAWEPAEGFNSSHSYHVRAVARGDNQVNRIRAPLTAALASGRASARASGFTPALESASRMSAVA